MGRMWDTCCIGCQHNLLAQAKKEGQVFGGSRKRVSFVERQQVERLLRFMFVNRSDGDKKWWRDFSFVLLSNDNKKLSADLFSVLWLKKSTDTSEDEIEKGFRVSINIRLRLHQGHLNSFRKHLRQIDDYLFKVYISFPPTTLNVYVRVHKNEIALLSFFTPASYYYSVAVGVLPGMLKKWLSFIERESKCWANAQLWAAQQNLL